MQCHPTCKTCGAGGEVYNCKTCWNGFTLLIVNADLQIGYCKCEAENGFVFSNGECIKCHTSCKLCKDSAGEGSCLSCTAPSYFVMVNETFNPQPDSNTGHCISECPVDRGFFSNTSGPIKYCTACHETCRTCVESQAPDKCTSCT